MKVTAFNASPRKQTGTTDIILDHFLDGAREAGATKRKYYVTELDIKGCVGCFQCWTKTPGRCIHRDDMDWIIPEYLDSDIIVFSTPIYNGNIIHYLQRMTERLLPTVLPWMEEQRDITYHPERQQRKPQKTVLIATAGFPDHQAFNVAKTLFPNSLLILLPASQILQDPEGAKKMKPFIEAVKKAARHLIQKEAIDPETKNNLTVQYSPEMKNKIRGQANKFFESMIGKRREITDKSKQNASEPKKKPLHLQV